MRLVSLLLTVLVISGCAALPTEPLPPSHQFRLTPGKGYVFATLSQTFVRKERSAVFDDSYVSNVCIDCGKRGRMGALRASVVGGKDNSPDPRFPGENGNLFVFELPVGDHQIDHWWAREAYTTISPEAQVMPLKFTVNEGEILYLGNIHMALTFGKNVLGAPVTTSVLPEVRRHFERDRELLLAAYPHAPPERLRNAPLPAGAWSR